MRPRPSDFRRLGEAFFQPVLHQRFDFALALVGELLSVRAEQLDAVVMILLCEAEIITPRSARSERVSIATAGVGRGPNWNTSMPRR